MVGGGDCSGEAHGELRGYSSTHKQSLLSIVDSWEHHYVENKNTGEYEMVERYASEDPVGTTSEYKYLIFIGQP